MNKKKFKIFSIKNCSFYSTQEQSKIIDYNNFESYSLNLLLNLIKPNSTFIDIGAHFGFYSTLIGKNVNNLKITAIEPIKENYNILKKNLDVNRIEKVKLLNVALSNKLGTVKFNLAKITSRSSIYKPQYSEIKKQIIIKTYPLDSLVKSGVDFVKIDVEGHEIPVLKGMTKILKKNPTMKLLVEFNPASQISAGKRPVELLQLLSNLNYDLFAVYDYSWQLQNKNSNQYNKTTDRIVRINNKIEEWNQFVDQKYNINILCLPKRTTISILMFSHTAGLGGSERSLLELIKELQELNVICHVVLPYEGPIAKKLKEMAVDYIIINYQWWCNSNKLSKEQQDNIINESFNNLLKNNHNLDLWDADIVFTNTLTIPWGSIYAKLTDKPHITFIREFGDLDFGLDFFYGYKNSIEYIKNHSNYIFTNSKATLNHINKYINKIKSDYSYTYINIPKNVNSTKISAIYKHEDSLKLMITGGILPTKNQLEAVIATDKLLKKNYSVELAILGPTYDPQYLNEIEKFITKQKISDRIHFLGFKEDPYPYMNKADIALVCSKNESYGRVTIENMALKKPVIATNSGANTEFIKHDYNGYLYNYNNPNQLSTYIEKFIRNKSRIKTMGMNSYIIYRKIIKKQNYGPKIYKQLKSIVINYKRNKTKSKDIFNNKLIETYTTMVDDYNETIQTIKDLKEEIKNTQTNYEQKLQKIYSSKTWQVLYYYKKLAGFFKDHLLK